MAALEQRGLRALPLIFAQVGQVPQNTDLVVLASPLASVGSGAVQALLDYVARGGNLLWLTEPDTATWASSRGAGAGHRRAGRHAGRRWRRGAGLKDPRVVAVGTYPPHAITDGFALTNVFPQVAPLAKVAAQGWDIRRSSSRAAELESAAADRPAEHVDHPVRRRRRRTEGAAGFRLCIDPAVAQPGQREQRVVVIGDGDFLSNSFLGNAGNAHWVGASSTGCWG